MTNLSTKIFLDSGSPSETDEADTLLKSAGLSGLDGQTTNPSLIVKNLESRMQNIGKMMGEKEAVEEYKTIVQEMAKIVKGPISIQVIGGPTLTTDDMLSQARDRLTWISNAVIKFPCTRTGLAAAEIFCEEGPVNMTIVFTQAQAAAVYAATRSANYDVYVSPYVGKHDDSGENGMDVVANILSMYGLGDGHVNVLAASIRSLKQLQFAFFLKCDAVTVPLKILKEWLDPVVESKGEKQIALPGEDFIYNAPGLLEFPY